jgi:hypothetical protein
MTAIVSDTPSKGKIIVFGILFWYPLAGVTWQFLHYLIGLRRLGYDPYYVEDSARWVYDPQLNDLSPDPTPNLQAVASVLEQYGFGDRWAYRGKYEGGECHGMSEQDLMQLYRDADAFLNVTGAQEIREEHLAIPRRIYVESDPFASQVKVASGDSEMIAMLDAHDTHFTFGENIGAPDCGIPVERYRWYPTRQPVALEHWNPDPGECTRYTTITTWHNKGKNIEYRGDTYYWTKDREFEKVLSIPRLCTVDFELSTFVTPEVRDMLLGHGWHLSDAMEVSRDVERYRRYIRTSRAEFTIARDQYVRPNTGWFSDRTACYLAAGRPVITQETGFSKYLPTGRGLYSFTSVDDIVTAVEAIESDYEGNCRAAREIAEEYFDAAKVVGSIMQRAGL